jgi:hypothetical protein
MSPDADFQDTARFQTALHRFDEANALDPNRESVDGTQQPRELVYAQRLSHWVQELRPDASEALRLAARCQHIRRWEFPRSDYPMTREGYLQWKETLKRRHADIASALLREVGYPESMIDRVQSLNLKRNLKQDEECQTLEDALCLVFLQYQFEGLASKTSDEKIITALKKSWAKMSPRGREAATGLKFGKRETTLLQAALSSSA